MPPDPDKPVWVDAWGQPLIDTPAEDGALSAAATQGIELLRRGRFAEAGRIFAADLRDAPASPDLYMLIGQSLFALGKYSTCEMVFRQAIGVARDLDFLDRADTPGRFPSLEILAEKLAALEKQNPSAFLVGLMQVLAGKREAGLALLAKASREDPAARKVCLHFIGEAFGPAEEQAAPAPKDPGAGAKGSDQSF